MRAITNHEKCVYSVASEMTRCAVGALGVLRGARRTKPLSCLSSGAVVGASVDAFRAVADSSGGEVSKRAVKQFANKRQKPSFLGPLIPIAQ